MKKILFFILLIALSIALSACNDDEKGKCTDNQIDDNGVCIDIKEYYNNAACQEDTDSDLLACGKVWSQYLHTTVSIVIYFDQFSGIDSTKVFDEMEEIINYYHIYSDKYEGYDGINNVHAINQEPEETHVLDEKLFNLIEFTIEHQDEVDNLFNLALGPVLSIWHDYREDCNNLTICDVPTTLELEAADQYTDPSKIVLDRENLTITMEENMSIDLGGVSKGYITRELNDYLNSLDLYGYLLNNGTSNVSVGGLRPKRESGEFYIGLMDPRSGINETASYASVRLQSDDHLVTSGDYQQYYEAAGTLYHHIIHSETLMPERYSRAVSIIATDPALADLYSTGIFLMPIEYGLTFVNNIEGLEAIWFTMDEEIVMSNNFEEYHLKEILID